MPVIMCNQSLSQPNFKEAPLNAELMKWLIHMTILHDFVLSFIKWYVISYPSESNKLLFMSI